MNSRVSNTQTLQPDDINGIRAIYSTGPAYHSIPNGPVLMNLSTRGITNTGDNVLIGGFVVEGSQPAQFIIRAIAFSLSTFGIAHVLGDSLIELYVVDHYQVAFNGDWLICHY